MHTSSDGWFLEPDSRADWPETAAADTVLNAISDVFYIVDRRGRFVEWNDRFREVTGYTDEEIADRHQFDFIPDEYEYEARRLLATVADGTEAKLQAPLLTADGEQIPHEFTASPLTDDDGEVWGMAGIARDVSTQRADSDILRDLHTSSRTLLAAETAQDVANSTVRIAHDHFDCATAGVRLLDGEQLEMVAVATENERLDERLPPYEVGEGFVGEAYERGEPVIVDDLGAVEGDIDYDPARSAMLLPISGHGMVNIAATEPDAFDEADLELGRVFAADVEAAFERADREQQLRERKRDLERYETLVETIADGVYATDADHEVTMINDAAADILGYERETLLGRSVDEFGDTSPTAVATEREKLLAGEQSIAHITDVIDRPDGTSVHVENRFALLPGEEFQGTVGVVRDVTEQREREQLLHDLHDISRALMTAETKRGVAERATQVAELLGFDSIAVRLLDADDRLTVAAQSTNVESLVDVEMPTYEVGQGTVGTAYEQGEPVVHADIADVIEYDTGPLESVMFLPIPGHGMMSVAATEPDAFDETDLELGRVFAADVEAAFERADREQQLRERKRDLERYEAIVETMGDGVYVTDPDGRIAMVNDTIVEMSGYDRSDLVGARPTLVTDESAVETANALVRRLLEEDVSVVTHETEAETADGRRVLIENRMSLLPGDEFQGSVGVVRDVTGRRRREEQLERNRDELRRSRDELARLNRINELIQETIRTLASAATREEIEATVCERLADSEFYRFALTGDLIRTDGVVECNEWAGEGAGYLDAFSMSSDDDENWCGPGGRAVQTGEVQVCQDVSSVPQTEAWREAALEHEFRSVTAVPLRHGETIHGVLFVYAEQTDAFSQRELRAFEVLGDMVGFAISATHNRRLVQADQVQEFVFHISETGTVSEGLTDELDCRYRLLGVASTAEPGMLHYVAIEGTSVEEIRAVLTDNGATDRLRNLRIISDDGDTCLVEGRIVGSIAEILQESGVQTIGATAEDGTIEFVARGPRDLDFWTLIETLESTHGEVDFVSKREVDADERAGRAKPLATTDRLTDRQSAALNAAYFSGYFDWPRDSTAEEVADALGISSATLHQHLRHAQRKLIEACFVDGADRNLDT